MTLYMTPSRRMITFRHAMDRMLENSIAGDSSREREVYLGVNIRSNDEGYTLHALVPGLTAEDVKIEVLNDTIVFSGEFKPFEAAEDSKSLLSELPSGKFSRVITLPAALDAARVEASIKDGILTLWAPKAEAHRPKTIQVKVA